MLPRGVTAAATAAAPRSRANAGAGAGASAATVAVAVPGLSLFATVARAAAAAAAARAAAAAAATAAAVPCVGRACGGRAQHVRAERARDSQGKEARGQKEEEHVGGRPARCRQRDVRLPLPVRARLHREDSVVVATPHAYSQRLPPRHRHCAPEIEKEPNRQGSENLTMHSNNSHEPNLIHAATLPLPTFSFSLFHIKVFSLLLLPFTTHFKLL